MYQYTVYHWWTDYPPGGLLDPIFHIFLIIGISVFSNLFALQGN